MWCSLMHNGMTGPFICSELAVTGLSNLGVVELYVLSWLPTQTVFQQMGHCIITATLITQCLADGLAEKCQLSGLLGHQT